MMAGAGIFNAGTALLALIILPIWIAILVWIAARIQIFIRKHSGWHALDWRNAAASFVLLIAAIHLGSFTIDLLDRWFTHGNYAVELKFPGIFLIGSAAIGVGIALFRARPRK